VQEALLSVYVRNMAGTEKKYVHKGADCFTACVSNLDALPFQALDVTQADYTHALRKQCIAEELKPAFAREGNQLLYEVHAATATGTIQAIEAGQHVRDLSIVTAPAACAANLTRDSTF
jgi:hypothetical protein